MRNERQARARVLPASLRGAPTTSGEAALYARVSPEPSEASGVKKEEAQPRVEGQVKARRRRLPASLAPGGCTEVCGTESPQQSSYPAELKSPDAAAAPLACIEGSDDDVICMGTSAAAAATPGPVAGRPAAAPGTSRAAGGSEESCIQRKAVKPDAFSMMMSASRGQAPPNSKSTPNKKAASVPCATAAPKSVATNTGRAAASEPMTGACPTLHVTSPPPCALCQTLFRKQALLLGK